MLTLYNSYIEECYKLFVDTIHLLRICMGWRNGQHKTADMAWTHFIRWWKQCSGITSKLLVYNLIFETITWFKCALLLVNIKLTCRTYVFCNHRPIRVKEHLLQQQQQQLLTAIQPCSNKTIQFVFNCSLCLFIQLLLLLKWYGEQSIFPFHRRSRIKTPSWWTTIQLEAALTCF